MEKINWNEKLFEGILHGDLNQVREALRNGAKANAKYEPFGSAPLHLAADKNDVEAGKVLKEYGGNMNQPDKGGYTPPMIAVARANLEFFEFSLEAGNNVNLKNKNNETQLIIAIKELKNPLNREKADRYIKIIKRLVEAKAKVSREALALLEGEEEFEQVRELLQKRLEEQQKEKRFPTIRLPKINFNFRS
jgi:hypothetical protein